MKLIWAIIKPFRLDDVHQALQLLGVTGMTVSEVRGFGRQKGQSDSFRGLEYQFFLLPKIKIEILVLNAMADAVLEAIVTAGRSGKVGDGKILVIDVSDAIRVRTGETGERAI